MARLRFFPNWRAIYSYLKDQKTPWGPKLLVVAVIGYLLLPIDLFPDFIPVIGWLDDLGIATLALWYLSYATERSLAAKKE